MNWKAVLKWGLVLGLSVVAWQMVMGFTRWYMDPVLANLFLLVVLINIVVIVFALRTTKGENGYGKQVLHGLMIGLVGGVLILGGSMLFSTLVAPDYANEVADMQQEVLTERGLDAELVTTLSERTRNTSAFASAAMGFAGTVVTSLVVSLITAAFVRRRD